MRRLVLIVEQLSEAARFIKRGGVPHARMALLLIDNAAEVMLQRSVNMRLLFDESNRGINERRAQWEPQIGGFEPFPTIPEKPRKNVFSIGGKIDLLVHTGDMDANLGVVISALHRYRNDAYHHEENRPATLAAAATLYFEICCELLVDLPGDIYSLQGGDDWSDFNARFRMTENFLFEHEKYVAAIAARLREEVGIDIAELASLLGSHLEERIEDLIYHLEFLQENANSDDIVTLDHVIRRCEFWKVRGEHWRKKLKVGGRKVWKEVFADARSFAGKHRAADLERWRDIAEELRSSSASKLELLRRYSEIEQEMEPLEKMVEENVMEVDAEIQRQVDAARGK